MKEQFYIIQSEVMLKQGKESWSADQEAALKWAESVFEKMDPHAREDILKFKEKLERIDKDLDRSNKIALATHVDYYAIKEEYTALADKRNAYQQAYSCLSEQMKLRKKGKQWKLKKMLSHAKNNYFQVVNKSSKKTGKKTVRAPQMPEPDQKRDYEDKLIKEMADQQ